MPSHSRADESGGEKTDEEIRDEVSRYLSCDWPQCSGQECDYECERLDKAVEARKLDRDFPLTPTQEK